MFHSLSMPRHLPLNSIHSYSRRIITEKSTEDESTWLLNEIPVAVTNNLSFPIGMEWTNHIAGMRSIISKCTLNTHIAEL